MLLEHSREIRRIREAAGIGDFGNCEVRCLQREDRALDPDALDVVGEALLGLRIKEVRQVVGGTAEQVGEVVHAQFRVCELLADEAFRLKHLTDVTVELAAAGLDDVAKHAEQGKQQPLYHGVACRALAAVGLGDAVRQRQEGVEVGRIEELNHLDIRLSRPRLMGEMQAKRVVVKSSDEIAEGMNGAGMHHFAMGHTGWNHAHLPFTQAKFLTWKSEVGRTVQLQENLRAVMIVHTPAVFDRHRLLRHAQRQAILLHHLQRMVEPQAHLRAVVPAHRSGGKKSVGRFRLWHVWQ